MSEREVPDGKYSREKFDYDLQAEVARECRFCGRSINILDINEQGSNRVVVVDTEPHAKGWVVWSEDEDQAVIDEDFELPGSRWQRHRCKERRANRFDSQRSGE